MRGTRRLGRVSSTVIHLCTIPYIKVLHYHTRPSLKLWLSITIHLFVMKEIQSWGLAFRNVRKWEFNGVFFKFTPSNNRDSPLQYRLTDLEAVIRSQYLFYWIFHEKFEMKEKGYACVVKSAIWKVFLEMKFHVYTCINQWEKRQKITEDIIVKTFCKEVVCIILKLLWIVWDEGEGLHLRIERCNIIRWCEDEEKNKTLSSEPILI